MNIREGKKRVFILFCSLLGCMFLALFLGDYWAGGLSSLCNTSEAKQRPQGLSLRCWATEI